MNYDTCLSIRGDHATIQYNMKQIVRTRIAPSPTGEDLHIGSVYMALFNYAFAKKHKGKFIVRIEDTDRERFIKGAEEKMLHSLKWVGIRSDEDPKQGGPCAPYRQSERLPLYKKYAEELISKKKAYYCFCTPERLTELREFQQKQKLPPMYDGSCKTIPLNEARERATREKYVIRLDMPGEGETVFTDLIRGDITFQNSLIDDQVLLKSDGFPTYHLAVVVDDHLMEISHIIRGEEWISSTPKHIVLYNAFGWNVPHYAHLPLLRNPDTSKLSKRKNPVWLSWFRTEGFLPEAILNFLGTLTWSMPDGRDIFTLSEMIAHFDLSAVKTTAPVFNLEKLKWLNGEYIRKTQNSKLKTQIRELLGKEIDVQLIEKLIPLAKERMKTLKEFAQYLKPFTEYVSLQLTAEQMELITPFLSAYEKLTSWDVSILESVSKELVTVQNFKMKDAFMAVRLAVTGEKIGLPLFETLEILGKKEVLTRLFQSMSA